MKRKYWLNILLGLIAACIAILFAGIAFSILMQQYSIVLKREASIGDYLSSIAILVGATGLFFTWAQLRYNSMQKRAEIAIGFLQEYLKDSDMSRMFYDLEYGRFKYDDKKFSGSDVEIRLDKLLAHFEKVSRLIDLGILKMEDLLLIRYEFARVYNNPEVQAYFERLDKQYEFVKQHGGNFPRFRVLAPKLENYARNRKA
jgi:hypothetical protein